MAGIVNQAFTAPLSDLSKLQSNRRALLCDAVSRLDRIQELGSNSGGAPGHTGCVNALAWSPSGSLLASGSDDFRCCLWRVGASPGSLDPVNDIEGVAPNMGISLETVIHTGHRRNIFGVKFAPSKEERVFTCAGDATVRVFDLEHATTGSVESQGNHSWTEYSSQSCRLRQFNCHTSRVKRIQTEGNSPDVFLTCSEDGTVRQHDLRANHSCCSTSGQNSCPQPLADYSHSIELFSLSLAQSRPELFVCAGSSPYAFLHDRRFSRPIEQEWGVPPASQEQLSQCVRRFTLPECVEGRKHITACKLSDDAQHLVATWSDGPVGLFDVFGSPDAPPEAQEAGDCEGREDAGEEKSNRTGEDTSVVKRKRSAISENVPAPSQTSRRRDSGQQDVTEGRSSRSPVAEGQPPQRHEHQQAVEPEANAQQAPSYAHLADQEGAPAFEGQQTGAELPPAGDEEANEDEQMLEQAFADVQENGLEIDEPLEIEEDEDPFSDEGSHGGEFQSPSEIAEEDEEDSEPDYDPLDLSSYRRRRPDPCLDVPKLTKAVQTYSGHCNSRTVKDVNFLFSSQQVVSGSDDGHFFIWDRESGDLMNILSGDEDVVNVITAHPYLPVVACSGIDSSIKIFAPTAEPPRRFSVIGDKERVLNNNARMLENGSGTTFLPRSALMSFLVRPDGDEEEGEGGGRTVRLSADDLRTMARGGECILS